MYTTIYAKKEESEKVKLISFDMSQNQFRDHFKEYMKEIPEVFRK